MKAAICKTLSCNLLLLFSLLFTALAFAEKSPVTSKGQQAAEKKVAAVVVINAGVILPLGQSRDTKLFFTLKNNSANPLKLISISSAHVEKIQWIPGKSSLPDFWTIAPHQQLVLDNKIHYIQLLGLKQPISTGDELLFELGFSDGSNLQLVAKAQSAYDQIHSH